MIIVQQHKHELMHAQHTEYQERGEERFAKSTRTVY